MVHLALHASLLADPFATLRAPRLGLGQAAHRDKGPGRVVAFTGWGAAVVLAGLGAPALGLLAAGVVELQAQGYKVFTPKN